MKRLVDLLAMHWQSTFLSTLQIGKNLKMAEENRQIDPLLLW